MKQLYLLLLFVIAFAVMGSMINGFKKENFGEVFIRAAGSMLAVVAFNYVTKTDVFEAN